MRWNFSGSPVVSLVGDGVFDLSQLPLQLRLPACAQDIQ